MRSLIIGTELQIHQKIQSWITLFFKKLNFKVLRAIGFPLTAQIDSVNASYTANSNLFNESILQVNKSTLKSQMETKNIKFWSI